MVLKTDSSAGPVGFRRRTFAIRSRESHGQIAAIDLGDPDRPVDLIFLHANGFNALTYRDLLSPLADDLRILAIDQEGHGRSPRRTPDPARTHWLGFRDDLIAVLDQIGQWPVLLAGHSMGGAVAALAAARRPDRVRALALFDPVVLSEAAARNFATAGPRAFADSPLAAGALRRRAVFAGREAAIDSYLGRGAFKTWPQAALADYVADGFQSRADGQVELSCAPAWEADNFAAPAYDVAAALHGLTQPVSILRAQTNSTCAIDSAAGFVSNNPRFDVETIAGSTHFLPIERPDLARGLIRRMAALG